MRQEIEELKKLNQQLATSIMGSSQGSAQIKQKVIYKTPKK
jgi:hypothetical protein